MSRKEKKKTKKGRIFNTMDEQNTTHRVALAGRECTLEVADYKDLVKNIIKVDEMAPLIGTPAYPLAKVERQRFIN